jgi:hypothetical protein
MVSMSNEIIVTLPDTFDISHIVAFFGKFSKCKFCGGVRGG